MPSDREYPARPIVGVGAVILVSPVEARAMGWAERLDGTGIVLVKRRFEPLAGQWSLPGGTLEVGETLTAGLAREVVEETGLTVDVGPMVEVFDRIFVDDAGLGPPGLTRGLAAGLTMPDATSSRASSITSC